MENINWDMVSAIGTVVAAIISGIAIIVAVRIPKKIADQQNDIALFEKRLECYGILENFLNFCILLNHTDCWYRILNRYSSHFIENDLNMSTMLSGDLIEKTNEYAIKKIKQCKYLFNDCNYKLLSDILFIEDDVIGLSLGNYETNELFDESKYKLQLLSEMSNSFKKNSFTLMEKELNLIKK